MEDNYYGELELQNVPIVVYIYIYTRVVFFSWDSDNRQSTKKHNTYQLLCVDIYTRVVFFSWDSGNRQSTKKHNTYQLLCVCVCIYIYIYSISPDDGLKICPKHVVVDSRNKLRLNSASIWYLLHELKERGCENMNWIHLEGNEEQWRVFVDTVMNFGFHKT